MTAASAILSSALLSVASPASAQGALYQTTTGWCSPIISNVTGNVSVKCIGVDPQALVRLNEQLNRSEMSRAEALATANDWAQRYRDLKRRLSRKGVDRDLSRRAMRALRLGRLDEAGAILDEQLKQDDDRVARAAKDYRDAVAGAAEDHYNRGQIYQLQFSTHSALFRAQEGLRSREGQ